MTVMTPADERRFRTLHAATLMSLLCVGLYAASFGPALPFIADDLGVSLDTAGLLLTALFCGSVTASSAVAVALHRTDTRALIAWGLAGVVAGSLAIGFAPTWEVALAGGAALGFGDGLLVAAGHILMARTSRDVPHAINRLNLFFAYGAVAGPLWAGASLSFWGERALVYAGIAAVAGITLAVLILAGASTRDRITAPDEEFSFSISGTTWVMGAVLFLYVGAEFGLGSWVSSYARESTGAGVFSAALITTGYWSALLCGRLFTGRYFARGGDSVVLLVVAVVGAGIASTALALSSGSIIAGALAAFAAGLFLGPVWPSTVAVVAEESAADATAAVVTLGNAGGLAIPWLQGRILVNTGPTEGVIVTSALCAAMFAIAGSFMIARRAR